MPVVAEGVCKYITFRSKNWGVQSAEAGDWIKRNKHVDIVLVHYESRDRHGMIPTRADDAAEWSTTICYKEPLFKFDLSKIAVGMDVSVSVPA